MCCRLCHDSDLTDADVVRAFGWIQRWTEPVSFIVCKPCFEWARSDDAKGVVHSIIVEGDN